MESFSIRVEEKMASEGVRYSQSPTTGKQQYTKNKKIKEEPCWPLEVTAYRSSYGNKRCR
jgi:hypothetical protein